MRPFRTPKAWQKSRVLLLRLDPIIKRVARSDRRIADQLRRAGESIPEALAEGCGRASDKDFAHYVSIASGSASEVENLIQRGFDLLLITQAEYDELTDSIVEVRKILFGLHRRLTR